MIVQVEIAFELPLQFFQKRAVGIEPRHFVFILVGHQREQVARHGLGKAGKAAGEFCFSDTNRPHRVAIALRVSGILVILEKRGAVFDQAVEPPRFGRTIASTWARSWAARRPQAKLRLLVSTATPLSSMARAMAARVSGTKPFWNA